MKYLYLILCVWAMSGLHRTYALEIPIQQDTIKQDSILTSPYLGRRNSRSLATYSYVKKDDITFQTYAGFNVLNTLRGHIPNLALGPNASDPSGLFRGSSATLVIDGLPHSSGYSKYYNLNSFEYETIYAQPSGSAALEFGGQATNGVVYLESKNGRDASKGVVEINMFPTLINNSSYLSNKSSRQWWLANAISYAQDFGVFDTRVSYTGTFLPDDGSDPEIRGDQHFLKVNSGVEFSKKFNMRLIQDLGFKSRSTDYQKSNSLRSVTKIRNFQQKLIVNYQPSNWFTLRYQSSIATLSDIGSMPSHASELRQGNLRLFANVTAIFNHTTDKLSINAFAGGLYEHQKSDGTMAFDFFGHNVVNTRYNMQSLLTGFGVHLKNYWFNDVKFRIDQFNASFNSEDEPAYSISSSFIFTEALNMSNTWLSFGKVRGSFGAAGVNPIQSYPFINKTFFMQEQIPPSLKSAFNRRNTGELGADLTLYRILDFSFSYFKDKNAETITRVLGPIGYHYIDLGETHTNGFEAVMSANVFNRGSLILNTKFTWATYQSEIVSRNTTQGSGSELANPTPDWVGSLLNQVTARNFFLHVLLDMRKGGDLLLIRTPGNYEIIDATNIVLRDISVGFKWRVNSKDHQQAQLSFSARNMFTLYSKFYGDVEAWINSYPTEKSFSVSMSLRF